MKSVLVATGAAFEARIAAGAGVVVVCAGGDPSRLRRLLDDLDPANFRAVISFGLAGGLDPALRPGKLLIADQIMSGKGTWQVPRALADAMQSALIAGGVRPLRLSVAGADATVMDRDSKAALRSATGASAVDMESHVVAGYAVEAAPAVGILAKVSPDAAAWWRENTPHLIAPKRYLVFHEEVCRIADI